MTAPPAPTTPPTEPGPTSDRSTDPRPDTHLPTATGPTSDTPSGPASTTPSAAPSARPLSPARRALLEHRVQLVVRLTIGYNIAEAVIALSAGQVASSSALIGFGLDSLVEVLSAAAVAWQFAGRDPERRERTALRLIAVSFFGLALVVGVDAVRSLVGAEQAAHSPVGISLAVASLLIMPFLSWFERRTGRELGLSSAVADSRQTLLCTYLSGVLLVGLVLNATVGWWWADPVAALVIAAVAVREGLEAWRGDGCCAPGARTSSAPRADTGADGTGGPCADVCGSQDT